MDTLTWLSLGLQLAALCSIAGALLLYLLKKVKGNDGEEAACMSKTVLVTSVDTALGLQIATFLCSRGWRVVGGCRSGGLGERLAGGCAAEGARLSTVPMDVSREDSLEEAVRAVAQHIPAGERGVWGVVNTAGRWGGGWETSLRANVLGALRVARSFAPALARAAAHDKDAGRLLYIGLTSDTAPCAPGELCESAGEQDAAVCFAASRWAVAGAARALRPALASRGVRVVALHALHHQGRDLYEPPAPLSHARTHTPTPTPSYTASSGRESAESSVAGSRPETPLSVATTASSCSQSSSSSSVAESVSVPMPDQSENAGGSGGVACEYVARVLSPAALRVVEEALSAARPKHAYNLPGDRMRVSNTSWLPWTNNYAEKIDIIGVH